MSSIDIYDLMMKSAQPTSARVTANADARRKQLRLAKRAQRAREREAGMMTVPLLLDATDAERMRVAMRQPDFAERINEFLDQEQVEYARYPNLAALCWNRRDRYIPAEDAFRLYERNWRHVAVNRMQPAEQALIDRLAARYGNGVLNV